MRQLIKRAFSLLLCAVMLLGMLPAVTAAAAQSGSNITEEVEDVVASPNTVGNSVTSTFAITENGYGDTYYFETFEDLVELAAGTYESWRCFTYRGEGDLIISKNLTLPDNTYLTVHGAKVIINKGVTLTTASSDWNDFDRFQELEVKGTLNVCQDLMVGKLTVSGTVNLNSDILLYSNAEVTGLENIVFQNGWSVYYDHYPWTFDEMVECLDRAAADPNGLVHYINFNAEYNCIFSSNVTIPSNAELSLSGPGTYTIPSGRKVTINGSMYVASDMVIAGTLVNNYDFTIDGWNYYTNAIQSVQVTGSIICNDNGHIWINKYEEDDDYTDVITGLDFDAYEVTEYPWGWMLRNPAETLKAPTVSVANVSSTGKIKLSWKAVDGAEEYKVYRSTSKNGTYKRLTTVTGTSVTNSSAVAGKQYYYYVVAVDGSGKESEKSNIVTRTCDLPRPELKISVVASTGKLKLSWGAIDGAVEYEVYRSTDGGKTYKLLKTTTGTSLTNTSITAGNKYYYKVKAIHSKSSANSAYSSAKYGTCDLPRPEVKISVVASTGKLKLRWDAIDGAAKYEVYRSTDGGKTYKLLKTTTGTSLTNTSITAGNKYYYKVKAIHSNSNANSAFSSVVIGTCDLPQPTLKIAVVSSTGKLKLSWNKVEGASKYELYRSTDGGKTYKLLKTTTDTSLTNTSIAAGNKYYYKVMAIHSNANANSAFSSVVSGTCDLARPTVTVKLNSSGKPVISWGKVEGAVKYTVYIYDADGELVKTSSTTSLKLTHSSAVKGSTYSYRVVAVHSNTNANSAKSIAVTIQSK